MEIRQLRYFIAIAETGSFSEASRRCCLTQSAISQQIKALEDELGTRLLERTPRRVTLTESGEHLLPLARRLVDDMTDCQMRMADVQSMLCGTLRIGLTYTMEPCVRRATAQFMRLHPRVQLHIHYAIITELMEMLRTGRLDMACTILGQDEDWLESIPVAQLQMCAVMRRTHPLATRQSLTFDELRRQPLILPGPGTDDLNPVHRYLSQQATGLQVRATINDACALLQLLKETNCVSVLSRQMVHNIDELCAIPIQELSTPITMSVHFPRHTYRKRSCTVFLDLMRQALALEAMAQE